MQVRINGKQIDLDKANNISDLIKSKTLQADRIVVEHNHAIISKDQWEYTNINDGDNIEIVSFVGGG